MPTPIVPEKGSKQPICPGEGHILPVITQAQSLRGMSMPVNNEPALQEDSLQENRHIDAIPFWTSVLGQFRSPLS